MNRNKIKLAHVFSFIVFLTISITGATTGFILNILYNTGILNSLDEVHIFMMFYVFIIIIGTILAHNFSRRTIRSIIAINTATKEVAQGNFDITIESSDSAKEIKEMAANFNRMTYALSKNEILHQDFISNVSHEFKTPLNVIEGYVTLLQDPHLTEESRKTYIQTIIRNTKRLNALTGSILSLSHLEHNEKPLEFETYSLNEQLRQVIINLEHLWNEKELDLNISLEPVMIHGNYNLLYQVWQNLLDNAIKFTPEKNSISIQLKQNIKNKIIITINDQGFGMDHTTQERLFEKFYQGDTSHNIEGNGLGLPLVKKIIELHHGTLEWSSELNHGTTFIVTLYV